jgi:anti-sigma B factor antagonist
MPLGGTIDVVRESQVWVIVLRGEHDLSTAADLKRSILPTSVLGVDVVIDLSELAFMDSSVLSVLVHASEEAASQQRAFAVVASPKPAPSRLLAVTGIDKRLHIYQTRADAFTRLATHTSLSKDPAP